jgi:hypothetical protein
MGILRIEAAGLRKGIDGGSEKLSERLEAIATPGTAAASMPPPEAARNCLRSRAELWDFFFTRVSSTKGRVEQVKRLSSRGIIRLWESETSRYIVFLFRFSEI